MPTIWFNPWKYDQKDEIWHALIQTVLTEIAGDLEKRRAAGEEPWQDRMADALAMVRRLSQAAAWLLARRAAGPLTGGFRCTQDAAITVLDSLKQIHPQELAESGELWELVQVAFGANPRRVRRFINGLNLTASTYALNHPASVQRLLHASVLLTLRMLHPAFFLILEDDPGIWNRFDDAEARKTELGGRDEIVDKQNPGVRRLLAAVSTHRDGFDFPPPPTADELRVLTEVLTVTGGLPSAPDDQS